MPDTFLHPAVARKHGVFAAILYAYLQRQMRDFLSLDDAANTRIGLKWVPSLSYETIQRELPVFPDVKTVKKAANELLAAGLVLAESTGALLTETWKTGRKRDIATWWHVSRDHVARKNVPAEYFDDASLRGVQSNEARAHGLSAALILEYWRGQPLDRIDNGQEFRLLSAAEMERKLPLDDRTIRRQSKKLVNRGVLAQHPKRKKLYSFNASVGLQH